MTCASASEVRVYHVAVSVGNCSALNVYPSSGASVSGRSDSNRARGTVPLVAATGLPDSQNASCSVNEIARCAVANAHGSSGPSCCCCCCDSSSCGCCSGCSCGSCSGVLVTGGCASRTVALDWSAIAAAASQSASGTLALSSDRSLNANPVISGLQVISCEAAMVCSDDSDSGVSSSMQAATSASLSSTSSISDSARKSGCSISTASASSGGRAAKACSTPTNCM